MAAPNMVSPTTITGKTSVLIVTTTATAAVTNATASGSVLKINSLNIANIHASNPGDITVDFYRSAVATRMSPAVTVAIKSQFESINKNAPVYLEEGDSIRLTASADSIFEAIISYEDIS